MYSATQSTTLFTSSTAGLQRVFQTIAANASSTGGISMSDITSNLTKLSSSDLSFMQVLQTNFTTLDADKDGKISQTEYNKLINQISNQGLTADQLSALASSQGVSTTATGDNKSLLQTVMENFDAVDTNHDGKVSKAEIDAYEFKTDEDKLKDDATNNRIKNLSIFYSDDSSSSSTDTNSDLSV